MPEKSKSQSSTKLELKSQVEQYIDVAVRDISSKRITEFYIQKDSKLQQLRKEIEKQWGIKNFGFVSEGKLQATVTESKKPARLIMTKGIINIQGIDHQDQTKEGDAQNTIQKLEFEESSSSIDFESGQIELQNNGSTSQQKKDSIELISIVNKSAPQPTQEIVQNLNLGFKNLPPTNFQTCYHFGEKELEMDEFLKYHWKYISEFSLMGEKIDDKKWRAFVNHSSQFPNLASLSLGYNQITTVKKSDILAFKSIQYISFGSHPQSANPLTEHTKQVLRVFQKEYPKIRLYFC